MPLTFLPCHPLKPRSVCVDRWESRFAFRKRQGPVPLQASLAPPAGSIAPASQELGWIRLDWTAGGSSRGSVAEEMTGAGRRA